MPERFLCPLHAVGIHCFIQELFKVIYQTSHFEVFSALGLVVSLSSLVGEETKGSHTILSTMFSIKGIFSLITTI